MLKIRLRRTGARKKPNYRIVVAESTAPRDGKYIEIIGTYDPLTEPATIKLDGDRAKHWLSVGAQPTERVVKLMAREGLVEAPVYAAKVTAPAEAEATTAEAATPEAATTADAPTSEATTAEPATPEAKTPEAKTPEATTPAAAPKSAAATRAAAKADATTADAE